MSDVRDMDDPLALERQICFGLAVASRDVIAVYRPMLDRMGITHPQYLVMLALWERSPLSVKELSELVHLDPGTLSPLLKRLQAGGLILRERHSADERVLAISLTGKGRALRAEAEKIPPTVIERLGMERSDLEDLNEMLSRLIAAARNAVR